MTTEKHTTKTFGAASRRDTIETHTRSAALALARLTLAAVFAFHGAQKMFGWFGGGGLEGTAAYFLSLGIPLPELQAWVVAATELVGALALLSGVGMRLALPPLAFAMLVGALVGHAGFDVQTGGMEYPLVLAATLLALAAVGPGRLTLGSLVSRVRGLTPARLPRPNREAVS